ncbi:MAG: hypothetical protein ACKVOW_16855 [Chitinophagaceae bacterium]
MFRKIFVRLFLVTILALSSLVIFAVANNKFSSDQNKECSEPTKEGAAPGKTEFMILESIGRTIINTANY